MNLSKNAIARKPHNGLQATWITTQINVLIMLMSFEVKVIDPFGSSDVASLQRLQHV